MIPCTKSILIFKKIDYIQLWSKTDETHILVINCSKSIFYDKMIKINYDKNLTNISFDENLTSISFDEHSVTINFDDKI